MEVQLHFCRVHLHFAYREREYACTFAIVNEVLYVRVLNVVCSFYNLIYLKKRDCRRFLSCSLPPFHALYIQVTPLHRRSLVVREFIMP
jgi:hypothetical protein